MDLSKIGYFFAMAETENVTKAAASCHIAQTSMSKYIASLEKEIGAALFERERNRLFLNENGREFYREMKEIEQKYSRLCESLRERSRERLAIGIVTTDYSEFELIEQFEKSSAGRQVFFTFCKEAAALDDLKSGRIDALIAPDILGLAKDDPDYEMIALDPTPVALFVSPGLKDRHKSVAELIAASALITKTGNEDYHHLCQNELQKEFGRSFDQVLVAESYPEQLLLLSLGRGFAILPLSHQSAEELCCINLPSSLYETQMLIASRKDRTKALSDLIRYIHEKKC